MGYIYIMTNPALHDMVKIGYANDVETRRQQLSTTALPYEYEIYATYETPGNLEDKKLHKMIDNIRDAEGSMGFYPGKRIMESFRNVIRYGYAMIPRYRKN